MSLYKVKGSLLVSLVLILSTLDYVRGVSVEQDLALTLSQKNTLDKFRARVAPLLKQRYMKQDIYLIRWLRARYFGLDAAETLLKQNIKWREDENMDSIRKEDWSDMIRDFPATIDTHDKEGRPIGVIDIYGWDIRRAAIQGRGQRLIRYMNFLLESITQQVFERQAKGMNVTQWIVLGNAESFNLIEHGCPLCIPLWVQFVQNVENRYPGWVDEFIIVDAPTTINVVIDAVKPFLHPQTRDALRIFSPNRKRWLEYLDEKISKDQRRAQYGGTKPPPKTYTG